ncbi:MAG: SUMF1/EgtB/PvdO family nonheme iron enzyme [Anaerolinea sp.]|nr:SUMF1/EgtB/PvdO family nonheme iron enzyme [Anaerolinea sp.]
MYDDLLDLFRPFMGNEKDRRAQIVRAFGTDNPIEGQLNFDLTTDTFILHLIQVLEQRFEEIEPGKSALEVLKESIEKQRKIEVQPSGASPLWTPGQTVDRYSLRKVLGEGGNGQVWLADETLPDGTTRQVAIKALKPEVSRDATRVKRFNDELSIMARIGKAHKNVVEIYTYGERGGHLYVVMPFMAGGTFREYLGGKRLDFETALDWLEQIGTALDYVHRYAKDLVHRDVKPENMLLSEDRETLYLSDFGLVISADSDERLSDSDKPVGTGRYMAPEQWRHEPLSSRTDLYALGILAYELLTGHLPYQVKGDPLLSKAHCEEPLPDDAHLTPEMLKILQKATAKQAVDRYETARAFLGDLRNWRTNPADMEPRVRDYLDWLTGDILEKEIDLMVELEGEERALLPSVPPKRRRALADEDNVFTRRSADVQADHVSADEANREYVENVREHLREVERVVLIGEPGCGKSWMLKRLTVDYSEAWLNTDANRRNGTPIPVLVRLNEYAGGSFADFVKEALDTLAPYHDRLLREGRLVVLCDALNEMPRADGQLDQLVNYLKAMPAQRFVVSCRVRDYKDELGALKPLEQVLLRELELPAIRDLILKRLGVNGESLWAQMGGTPDLLAFWQKTHQKQASALFWDVNTKWWEQREKFGESVWPPDTWRKMHTADARLIPLCRNPYMGHLLCTIHREDGRLPGSRAALFGGFVEKMLTREQKAAERRGQPFPAFEDIKALLVDFARLLQKGKVTVLPQNKAASDLTTPNRDSTQVSTLLRAATDANILSAEGDNLKYAHQLLQEYFAAKIMLEAMEADDKAGSHARAMELFGKDWWDAGVWRETTVILGEFLGEGAVGPNRVTRWLAPVTPEVALEVITRNAGGLSVADVEAETQTALVNGAQAKAEYNFSSHTWRELNPDPRGRASAWRVLGKLREDNRPGVLDFNWDQDYWCLVPKGEYVYQGKLDKIDYDFWIARYPITYAQFQLFIDAPDGYRNPDWWQGLHEEGIEQQQKGAREQHFKFWNHPRENVSWYEARAFCRWVDALTLTRPASGVYPLPTSALGKGVKYHIRLPLETEWEKAASWDAKAKKARVYPWGDTFDPTKANMWEGERIGQTTTVGIYPQGASPCGALDMSGNVWEWCLNEYEIGQATIDSDETRVLRGGSWRINLIDDFRCDSRNRNYPANWDYDGGVRLVIS